MSEGSLWEGLGPDEPLTPAEVSLLAALDEAGRTVQGLVLREDRAGHQFVAEFSYSTSGTDEAGAVSLIELSQVGGGLRDKGLYPLAAGAFMLMLRLLLQSHGLKHPDTIRSALNLAGVMSEQGLLARARDIEEYVYEALRHLLGAEHPDTLTAGGNLALTLYELGDLARARKIEEAVYDAMQRVLGPEHAKTLKSANNLAGTLRDQGDLSDARRIQESVYEAYERLLGPEHSESLTSASNLASTLREQGDFAGALRIESSAYETRRRVFGPEHPETLNSADELSLTLSAQGDVTGAIEVQQWLYEVRVRTLGPEHPRTINSAANLAASLSDQGDLTGARRIEESVYEVRQRMLGPAHRHTLVTAGNLALTLRAQGDLAACTRLSLFALRSLCQAQSIDSTALYSACDLPPLIYSSNAWSGDTLSELLELLPELSGRVQGQLLELTPEAAAPLYAALVKLQERLCIVASNHLAPSEVPAAYFSAVAPLHGPEAWAQLREAIASRVAAEGAVSEVARAYIDAERAVELAHNELQEAVQLRSALRQRRSDMQHQLTRKLRGDEDALQFDEPQLRQALAALQEDLQAADAQLQQLGQKYSDRQSEREQALQALAGAEPEFARQLQIMQGLGHEQLAAQLQPGELWLVPMPQSRVERAEDPQAWPEQFKDHDSYAYVVRHGQEPGLVRLGPLQLLGAATALYRQGLQGDAQRGQLRDALQERDYAEQHTDPRAPWLSNPQATLEVLRQLSEHVFWQPLSPLLEGIERIHLVTGPGQHQIMFECGQPEAFAHVRLHRYCGLPAYWRRAMDRSSTDPAGEATPALPEYAWAYDSALDSACPIPFTELDALIPRLRGLGRPQSGEELARDGPHSPLLLLACHGQSSGTADNPSGSIVLGEQRLQPAMLSQQRHGWRPARALVALSCFGGVVGAGGRGDAHGVIAALQAAGLHWAIACLAPVADFYTPLLSAVLHHELGRPGADPAQALLSAKRILRDGPWDEELQHEVLSPLRQAYAALMLELLERMRPVPGNEQHNRRAEALLATLPGWSLPGAWRRALQSQPPTSWLPAPTAAEPFVHECLNVLFRNPAQRQQDDADEDGPVIAAIDSLCAATVGFGRK